MDAVPPLRDKDGERVSGGLRLFVGEKEIVSDIDFDAEASTVGDPAE